MLKFNLCPRFKVFSVTFFLVTVNVLIYTVLLGISMNQLLDDQFLGIKANRLSQAGAKDSYKIRYNYQLWRWITPIFLHANFMHIFFNSVSLFWIGFMVEHNLGKIAFSILYMASGIGGFVFSSLLSDHISVGASGAIFGLVGILISNLVINWRRIVESGNFVSTVLIILMLSLISLSGSSHTDNYGHFGGLYFGFVLGLAILKYNQQERSIFKRLSFAGWASLIAFFLSLGLMIGLFFGVRHPKRQV